MKKALKFLVLGVFIFLGSCSDDVISKEEINNNVEQHNVERMFWGEWGLSGAPVKIYSDGFFTGSYYCNGAFIGDCSEYAIISRDLSSGNVVRVTDISDSSISFKIIRKNSQSFDEFSSAFVSHTNEENLNLYNLHSNNVVISENRILPVEFCSEVFPNYSGETIIIQEGIYHINENNEFALRYTIN